MGRLERHLDTDAIARVLNKTPRQPEPLKRVKPPRAAKTYRGVRRNAARGLVWRSVPARVVPYVAKPPILRFVNGELVDVRERKQPKTYLQPNYGGWKRRQAAAL